MDLYTCPGPRSHGAPPHGLVPRMGSHSEGNIHAMQYACMALGTWQHDAFTILHSPVLVLKIGTVLSVLVLKVIKNSFYI